MNKTDITELSLVDVSEAIATRKISAVEALEASLEQLTRLNPRINAVIWSDAEGALIQAAQSDKHLSKGAPVGLLHGVPLAHKDMFARVGRPNSFGSAIYRQFKPETTSTVLSRLDAAGAIHFAGLNLAEFAQNGTGHNAHFGDTCNPWNPDYITGGSSSGSGAAVAARLTSASLGSDTGGSVRLPASANGITGLKPTHSRVSRFGVMPLSYSHDNVGPLARSARDCARMMNVIAGHDPLDPSSSRHPVVDYEASLQGDLRGIRIGMPENYFFSDISAGVDSAYRDAVWSLKARGAEIIPMMLPHMETINTYAALAIRTEAASLHADNMRAQPQDMAKHINSKLYTSLGIPAAYYLEAMGRRGSLLNAFSQEVFCQVHAIVAPTISFSLPTRRSSDIDLGLPGSDFYPRRISDNTRPFNYLGLPAINVPCGRDENQLPVGMQIIGKPFSEALILQIADAYQVETDWHKMKPSMA